jgi:hypothetical protein
VKRALVLVCVVLSGCAATSGVQSAVTRPSDNPREELAQLSARVAQLRQRLGLPRPAIADDETREKSEEVRGYATPPERPAAAKAPPRQPAAPATPPPPPATAAPAPVAEPPQGAPAPPTNPSPEPAPAAPAPSEPVQLEVATTVKSGRRRSHSHTSGRCRNVAAAADEICRASERICVIADELAEADARRACDSAREDCRNARVSSSSCE